MQTQKRFERQWSGLRHNRKSSSKAVPSQAQVCRKIHTDMQEYAMQLIDIKNNRASGEDSSIQKGMRAKLTISQLIQFQPYQTLAIKFWIIMINLQYHDVKKLSMNFEDRQLALKCQYLCVNEVKLMHTSLPIDFIIYERIIPLFIKALGCLADPDFLPAQIPAGHAKQKKMKKNHKQLLQQGSVHFDKFMTDLCLILGPNLLKMDALEVCFVYRKVYQAMTYRFPDDMNFIHLAQIQSPFDLETILQVQRNRNQTQQIPRPLLIGPDYSSVTSQSVGKKSISETDNQNVKSNRSQGIMLQVQQNNNSQRGTSRPASGPSKQPTPRRNSINLKRESGRTSKKAVSWHSRNKSHESISSRQKYLKNERKKAKRSSTAQDDAFCDQLEALAAQKQSVQKPEDLQNEINKSESNGSMQRRRTFPGGVLNQKNISQQPDKKLQIGKMQTSGQNHSEHSEERKQPEIEYIDPNFKDEDHNLSQIKSVSTAQPISYEELEGHTELFNFGKLHRARQDFKDDLDAKRSMMQSRMENLIPFETLFTKKSCLDYLEQAREFLQDEELKVKKTPSGFSRPPRNQNATATSKKQIVLQKRIYKYKTANQQSFVDQKPQKQQEEIPQFGRTETQNLAQVSFDQQLSTQDPKNFENLSIHEVKEINDETSHTAVTIKGNDDRGLSKQESFSPTAMIKTPTPEIIVKHQQRLQSYSLESDDMSSDQLNSNRTPTVHVRKYGSPQDLQEFNSGNSKNDGLLRVSHITKEAVNLRQLSQQTGRNFQMLQLSGKDDQQLHIPDVQITSNLPISAINSKNSACQQCQLKHCSGECARVNFQKCVLQQQIKYPQQRSISQNSKATTQRLHMMTNRILQEKTIEKFITQRLVENTRQKSVDVAGLPQNEEKAQLETIFCKLNLDAQIMQQQSQQQNIDLTLRSYSRCFAGDPSMSQVMQRSVEGAAVTHLTSSVEESPAIISRPKLSMNKDQPVEILMSNKSPQNCISTRQSQNNYYLNQSVDNFVRKSLSGANWVPTPTLTVQPVDMITPEQKRTSLSPIACDKNDQSIRYQNSIRKRVFSNGGNSSTISKGRSPICDSRNNNNGAFGAKSGVGSPLHVKSVDKSVIEGMEGKKITLKTKKTTQSPLGIDLNEEKSPPVPEFPLDNLVHPVRVLPLLTNTSSQAKTALIGFDKSRKSYVTAQLSLKEVECDTDFNILTEADVEHRNVHHHADSTLKHNSIVTKNNSHRSIVKKNPTSSINQLNTIGGGQLSLFNRTKTLGEQNFPANQDVTGNDDSQLSDGNNIKNSFERRQRQFNNNSYPNSIQETPKIGRSQSGDNFSSSQQLLVAVDPSQHLSNLSKKGLFSPDLARIKHKKTKRNSNISVTVDNKILQQLQMQKLQEYKRKQDLRNIVSKQAEIFPFNETVQNQPFDKIYRSHTPNSTNRKSSHFGVNTKNQSTDLSANKALQSGLFALRRANKNRRQQLHKATASRKEYIINSKIPGVDYSRSRPPSQNTTEQQPEQQVEQEHVRSKKKRSHNLTVLLWYRSVQNKPQAASKRYSEKTNVN